ncbi:hypothetical protein, variant [Aphanomyces astaci]|uniref:Uncharacterized protein n=1 Tax=Aphanomyces astaci TaxID=112090 RepID=W4G3E6_APHAT|nr:hypothetical protein, variant [Aphanomyces astaci]ETV73811.1 hypothetical protein, variant [Aphanomyces astaci]|eukprot:XP_009836746.1 hypothetical protein, variant [Aphanomyces astaci]
MIGYERQAMIRAIASDPAIQRDRLLRVYKCLRECRATIDIADAVVVHQGELVHWYFTSKDGEVREKQPYALSLLELKKVFVKQGLQQTSNVARTLAVMFQEAHHQPQQDQHTTFTMLQDVQFNTHVCNPNSRLWMSTYLVTPYICGKFGPNHATYTGKYCRPSGNKSTVKFFKPASYFFGTDEVVSDNDEGRHLTHLTTLPVDSIYAKELGSAYDDALKHDILKLVQYIEAGTRHQILQLFADFVLTTSCRLILVRVSNVVFDGDRRGAPVSMAPPPPSIQAKPRPKSAHPSTHPHHHHGPPFERPQGHCPGHFCMVAVATRRHVHSSQNVISQKQECAFLAAAAAHPDANEQLANEVCHLVDMATFRNTIPNLRGVDALIQMRNRLLKELHWFDQQAQDVAAATKRVPAFYDTIHVCALCYIMYQRLDEARRGCTETISKTASHSLSTSALSAKSGRPKSAATSSSRLRQLAQPKTKATVRHRVHNNTLSFNEDKATTTPTIIDQGDRTALSTSSIAAPPPLAKCLRGSLALASRDAPVLSKSLALSASLADLRPIVPRRKL